MRNFGFAVLFLSLAGCSEPNSESTSAHADHDTAQHHDADHDDIGHEVVEKASNETDHDDEDHGDDTRQLGSHVHGGASLALVLEGRKLTAELETPLYNVLGFEHEPETDAQTEMVESVQKKLVNGSALFKFNQDAGCISIATSPTLSLFEEEHTDENHHDDDEHHDDEHHDEDHHDDEESHKDVVLTYNFICQNPTALNTLSVEMLNNFPLMTELDVIYLGPRSQSSYEVSASNIEIKLRP